MQYFNHIQNNGHLLLIYSQKMKTSQNITNIFDKSLNLEVPVHYFEYNDEEDEVPKLVLEWDWLFFHLKVIGTEGKFEGNRCIGIPAKV